MINWNELDQLSLPKGIVLAANFQPKTYGYSEKIIGYIYEEGGVIKCENEYELLEGCTHYVKVNDFDVSPSRDEESNTRETNCTKRLNLLPQIIHEGRDLGKVTILVPKEFK